MRRRRVSRSMIMTVIPTVCDLLSGLERHEVMYISSRSVISSPQASSGRALLCRYNARHRGTLYENCASRAALSGGELQFSIYYNYKSNIAEHLASFCGLPRGQHYLPFSSSQYQYYTTLISPWSIPAPASCKCCINRWAADICSLSCNELNNFMRDWYLFMILVVDSVQITHVINISSGPGVVLYAYNEPIPHTFTGEICIRLFLQSPSFLCS